ncbi:RNA polymerase sigma-70 factor, ECF subfamily [Pedobacter sp. ok626]|uniref:RNA polymerase sigma factor n=1 Tax=Pedobacter sp. ok626 TaxID=1761882 RepID=UPI0008926AFA|nr:RNA polymerase sigma-70 factor [Pedobacter sp. ok626]SDK27254.1 RNA polymerase sigma-70 factor, ECF subfamily [Pedobacter sp. ok626]
MSYSNHADQDLIALLRQGDHDAFTEIYKRYWSVLYLHARHMLREEDQARDVVQEVFAGMWNKHTQFEPTISLSAYLYKAVRNTILNIIRHGKIKENYLTDLGAFVDQEHVQTDELVRYNDLKRLIEKEILNMPAKMREVFEMSRNQGLSHAEIGAQLGISDLTVKKQVSKAVTILRKKFKIPLATLFILLRVLP